VRRDNEGKRIKRGVFKPKLQMEIDQLKATGMTDLKILNKLQAAGHKQVLQEIKYWSHRHDHNGELLWEPRQQNRRR